MKSLSLLLTSALKSLSLSAQRTFDHSYRQIVGVPTLRYSQITPQLYLGGQYSRRGYTILKKRGITGIISMRTSPVRDLPDLGAVRLLHLPTLDLTSPSLSDFQKGIKFIRTELENGGKVYVHCAHGEGRGPSMVAAYLISTGLTLEDALKQIRAVRKFIRLTKIQLNRLAEFEKLLY